MIIYETLGRHAGRPVKVLPRSYRPFRPLSSKELAARLRRLAYTIRDRGYSVIDKDQVIPKLTMTTPLNEVFRGGFDKLLGMDLQLFMARNTDLFPAPPIESVIMTYEDLATLLEIGAAKLECLK